MSFITIALVILEVTLKMRYNRSGKLFAAQKA